MIQQLDVTPPAYAPPMARPSVETLVNEHIGLVHHIARRRFSGYLRNAHSDDMIQAGLIGLWRAAELFDPSKGRFGFYASMWIRAKIQDYLEAEAGYEYTLSRRAAWKGGAKSRRMMVRLEDETPAGFADDGGQKQQYLDLIEDTSVPSPEALAANRQMRDRIRASVERHARSTREAAVVRWRIVAEDPLTLEEAGRRLGITREGARLIEKRVLLRAQHDLAAERPNPSR